MLIQKKVMLLVLLCFVITEINSQKNFGNPNGEKYLIKMGQKKFVPEKNVDEFAQIKKDLKENEFDGWFYAIVQFEEEPSQSLRAQMTGKINPIEIVGKTSFVTGLSTNISKKQLKKYRVRAIIPLSNEFKIDAELLHTDEESVKVDVYVSNDVDVKTVKDNIEDAGGKYSMKMDRESSNIYSFSIPKTEIETIASFPWILKVLPSQF